MEPLKQPSKLTVKLVSLMQSSYLSRLFFFFFFTIVKKQTCSVQAPLTRGPITAFDVASEKQRCLLGFLDLELVLCPKKFKAYKVVRSLLILVTFLQFFFFFY